MGGFSHGAEANQDPEAVLETSSRFQKAGWEKERRKARREGGQWRRGEPGGQSQSWRR